MRVSLTIPLLLCALPVWLWAQASDRARTLHQSAFVFDAHIHVVNRQFYHGGDIRGLANPTS